MVEKWKLKLVYNNIIRFIFTTDVTISPVFYYFPFCPFLHNYRRQYSLTFYYCPHSLQLLRPLPSSVVSASWSPRLCNIMIMQSSIINHSINPPSLSLYLAILCSFVIPALAACSLAALLFPLSFLAAFSLARSLWLPLVILDNVAVLRSEENTKSEIKAKYFRFGLLGGLKRKFHSCVYRTVVFS